MNFSQKLAALIVGISVATQSTPRVSAIEPDLYTIASASGNDTWQIAQAFQSAATLTPQQISLRAKQITVRIDGQGTGSGVIIGQSGKSYTVLTNWHVVEKTGQYTVQTPDGRSYSVDYNAVKRLPGVDLAILSFNTDQNYQIAEIGNSERASEGQSVYYAGYPGSLRDESDRFYRFFPVNIVAVLPTPTENGYSLVYDGEALTGMSGGPVLDQNGFLIGIHGQAFIDPRTGSSSIYAVPINTYKQLAQKAQAAGTAAATPPKPTTTATKPNASGNPTTPTKPSQPPNNAAGTGGNVSAKTPQKPTENAANTTQEQASKPNPQQPPSNPNPENNQQPSTSNNSSEPIVKIEKPTPTQPGSSSNSQAPNNSASTPLVTIEKPGQQPSDNNSGGGQVAINNNNPGGIPTFSTPNQNSTPSNPTQTTPSNEQTSNPSQPPSNEATPNPGAIPSNKPTTPNTQTNLNVNPNDSFLISAATGVDYRPLRDLLAQGKWQEADLATAQVLDSLVKVARNRNSSQFIDLKQVSELACPDLSTLDQLWQQYSNNRFGFRQQQQVWTNLATTGNYSTEQWRQFATQVGWKQGDVAKSTGYLFYDQLKFNPSQAPAGHLPWWFGYEEDYQNLIKYMFTHCSFDPDIERQKAAEAEAKTKPNEKGKKPNETKPATSQPNAELTPEAEPQQP
ncbi:MAG: GUN4 domain-containing protein [Xenococcaceae cyanobacterium]